MTNMMTQCRLQKNGSIQEAWIDSKLAQEGRIIKIKLEDGSWDEGWIVVEAWSTMSEEYVKDHQKNARSHRKATDI